MDLEASGVELRGYIASCEDLSGHQSQLISIYDYIFPTAT